MSAPQLWLREHFRAALGKPPIDPALLSARHTGESYLRSEDRFAGRPDSAAELEAGWAALRAAVPASPAVEARFHALTELIALGFGRRQEAPAGAALSAKFEEFLAPLQGRHGQDALEWSYVGSVMEELGSLLEMQARRCYRIGLEVPEAHPYFVAAWYGSLDDLRAADAWCRPSRSAVCRALMGVAGDLLGPKFSFCFRSLDPVDAELLAILGGRIEFQVTPYLGGVARQALFGSPALTPEVAARLLGVSAARRAEFALRVRDRRRLDDIAAFAWALPALTAAAALGLRFAWVASVVRAPRRGPA